MAKIYNKLPHAVTDLEDEFKVVFVGRAAPRKEQLAAEGWVRRVFGVRRWKVAAALQWLKRNNPLYAHVEIDSTALDALPNDGSVPASLWNAVQISTDVKAPAKEQSGYVQQPDNPATTRLDELAASSGLSDSKRGGVSRAGMSQSSVDHSAERKQDWQDPVSGVRPRSGASKAKDAAPLLEVPIRTSGWLDERGSTVSAQSVHSYAIQNALPRSSDPGEQSLYYLQHADAPVSELTEPRYLELAYPALFPFGRGGFDFTGRSKRPTRLSPQNYARRLMMLCDPRFRLHFSFKYILANVMMRRDVMRRASAKSKAIGFIEDSRDIAALQGKEVVAAIEELHKQPPGSVCKDPALAKFLRYINTWGGSIPNSDQWKRRVRQQIYAMVPLYGCVFPNDCCSLSSRCRTVRQPSSSLSIRGIIRAPCAPSSDLLCVPQRPVQSDLRLVLWFGRGLALAWRSGSAARLPSARDRSCAGSCWCGAVLRHGCTRVHPLHSWRRSRCWHQEA